MKDNCCYTYSGNNSTRHYGGTCVSVAPASRLKVKVAPKLSDCKCRYMISGLYTPSADDLGDDEPIDDFAATVLHVEEHVEEALECYGLVGHAYMASICDEISGSSHGAHPAGNPAGLILSEVHIKKGCTYRVVAKGLVQGKLLVGSCNLTTTITGTGSVDYTPYTRVVATTCSLGSVKYSLSTRVFILVAGADDVITVTANFNHDLPCGAFAVSDVLIDVEAVGTTPVAELGTATTNYTAMV